MQIVTEEAYRAFMAARATRSEPETERDGPYLYETWHDLDGRELGFVTWRHGQAVAWAVRP